MTALRTVLIADDDLDTRIVFGTYLRHFGLRVLEAATEDEARRLLRDEAPDVTLFDPTLSDLAPDDGSPVRAVAVSASILRPEITARLHARSIPVLQKPCSPMQVLETVRGLVERAQIGTPSGPSTSEGMSSSEEADSSLS